MADAAEDAPPPTAADAAQPAKVVVLFKATGDAPILKQNKFKARAWRARAPQACALAFAADAPRGAQISANERFGKVVDFLRKQIQRDSVVRRPRGLRRRERAPLSSAALRLAVRLPQKRLHAGPGRRGRVALRGAPQRQRCCAPPAARTPCFSRVKGFALLRRAPPAAQTFAEEGKLVLHYATTPAWG